MLSIRDLSVDKAGKTICRVPALEIQAGERVAVVGPNGSGKTTLLRVVAGLEPEFNGTCHTSIPLRDRIYVHQSPLLFRGSVLYNAVYGLVGRRIPRPQQLAMARKWLNTFGVEHLVHRQRGRLSGGEQRRVALARAFATEADILLLDEPFADLDQDGIEVVRRVITTQSPSTIVFSSPVSLAALPDMPAVRTFSLPAE